MEIWIPYPELILLLAFALSQISVSRQWAVNSEDFFLVGEWLMDPLFPSRWRRGPGGSRNWLCHAEPFTLGHWFEANPGR